MEELVERLFEFKVKNILLKVDKIRKPSGNTTERVIIEHPEAVGILPFFDDEKIVIVKQFRYAIKQDIYELPAGKIEPNELLSDALKRELEEETGYTSDEFHKLITIAHASGYSSEILHLYIAKNLKKTSTIVDEDEIKEVKIVTKEELMDQILENKTIDPLITLCLLLAEKKQYL
ncbi:MAG: NUDIX hydrolase [Candidatus Hodarchaeales archaeon]|jgi:ADP-ribose pyrophosphatase